MENAIELRGLRKHYKQFTLDGVSLTLPLGCIMGFIGENGAGKSTTIKAMLGLIQPDGGEIRLLKRSGRRPLRDGRSGHGAGLGILPSRNECPKTGEIPCWDVQTLGSHCLRPLFTAV